MAEVIILSRDNIHEVCPDDIVSFDGLYVEVGSCPARPEGIDCYGYSLYDIIEMFDVVKVIKRGG